MNLLKTIILTIYIVFITNIGHSQSALLADTPPTNIGGKAEFKRVFEQEVIYPEQLLEDKTIRKTTINFSINKDSSVSNLKIISSGEQKIDDEALRIFKLYQWIPSIKDGRYITTNWSATFEFDAKKYPKICKQRGYKKINYVENEIIDTSGIIYKEPDQFAMYQKGAGALQDFIKDNLEYPRQAQLANIQGTVILRFVVEPNGFPTNIGIEQSVGGGCDQEAIRILELIKWYPGKKNDKLVRVQMTFPIYFILNSDFKENSGGEQK
ncbi:MAG: energy transducer TonB [Bacteroidia bacterium]